MNANRYYQKLPGLKLGPKTLAKQRQPSERKTSLKHSIVLLLDASVSMEGEKMEDAKRVLISLLEDIDLAENEVEFVAFGGDEDIILE